MLFYAPTPQFPVNSLCTIKKSTAVGRKTEGRRKCTTHTNGSLRKLTKCHFLQEQKLDLGHQKWTFWRLVHHVHSVWKSQKKSHSTLRAKWATFTFLVDKSSLEMPKMLNFASFWKPKACGQTELPDSFNRSKI